MLKSTTLFVLPPVYSFLPPSCLLLGDHLFFQSISSPISLIFPHSFSHVLEATLEITCACLIYEVYVPWNNYHFFSN